MNGETTRQRTFQLMAEALEYPQPGLADAVRECTALLAAVNPAAAACLREFCTFVEETPPGRLEELYTGAFDLNAAWYPYVGYHLFGESYKRSVFMLELNDRYRAHGFPEGGLAGELPDHLAVLLRFLAACDDDALSEEIVQEALLPALDHMDHAMANEPQDHAGQRDYGLVLQALRLVLCQLPADNLPREATPMKETLLFTAQNEGSAKKASSKAQCCQYSRRRLKAILKSVVRRKASARQGKELWLAGCIR
jgi:nitrate reductase delta subunit